MPDEPESKSIPYLKNVFFIFVFIISFSLIKKGNTKFFGLWLFFAINLLYCVFTSSDVLTHFQNASSEQQWKAGILLMVMVFSFVSTILLAMTLYKLRLTFAQKGRPMKLGEVDSANLEQAETLFITLTVFMWVLALYTFKSSDVIQKTMFTIGDAILNGSEMKWVRIIFPVLVIGLGSALHGQLNESRIRADTERDIWCNPDSEGMTNGVNMSMFKANFIKTYWLLFGFVVMRLLRPVFESNSFPFFQRNGLFYEAFKLMVGDGWKDMFNFKEPFFATNRTTPGFDWKGYFWWFGLRWYTLYVWGMWALGIAALVYASYSIRDFDQLRGDVCMMPSTQIRQLFIAFIFFLICLYTVNVMTAYQFTAVLTRIMKHLVPPTALGLSAYLVYLTNSMSHLAVHQIIE